MRAMYFIDDESGDNQFASSSELDFQNSLMTLIEKIEPHIAKQIDLATNEDLMSCLIGFSHPHLNKRLPIIDAIEGKLAQSAIEGMSSLEETANQLFELANHQTGSKMLVNVLGKHLTDLIEERYELFSPTPESEGLITEATQLKFEVYFHAVTALDGVRCKDWRSLVLKLTQMFLKSMEYRN